MKVHYIQPYNKQTPPNIGGAINSAIKQLNSDSTDWIVLIDHDVMFLRPDSKAQLEEILSKTDFGVLGAVTNRLAQNYQLVQGMFDVFDVREHILKANELHELNYGTVIHTHAVLAAFCLCFKVSTWQIIGGFREACLSFDSQFSITARKKGFKTGIMTGIYVYHLYRSWSDHPKGDIKHLLQ